MHKHKQQPASPHNGVNESIPTKPAASFRCNRFLVRVFRLGLRTRECLSVCLSPFATERTNGVEESSSINDSHSLILILPFSFCRPSLFIIYLIVPLSTLRRACEELRLVSVAGSYNPFSQRFALTLILLMWRTR
jgi:hypothetical protein